MTQIKIEVPANDHIALSAMAEALNRIAAERGPQELTPSEMGVTQSNTEQLNDELEHVDVELNRLDEELEASIHHENTKHDEVFEETVNELHAKVDDAKVVVPSPLPEQDDTLDADGIPHDKRIHSKGATRLADNTWRLRKRPADKTEEEWATYIDSVKAELKAVQDIPSIDEQCDDIGIVRQEAETPTLDEQAVADLTPPVTLTEEQAREEIKDKLESGEVTVEAPLTPPVIDTETPVAPVTPPTSLTPAVVEAESDKPSVTTFQELMLYMTSDAKKRGADNDMIKATLLEVDKALTAIPLIATRADLIPKFVEALEAKLS